MKKIVIVLMIIAALAMVIPGANAEKEENDGMRDLSAYKLPEDSLYLKNEVMPDTWVFTDELGRRALTNADVGDPRDDRTVFMFYSTWHDEFSKSSNVFNVQSFLNKEAKAGTDLASIINDYSYSKWPGSGYQHFWDTPIYGYYSTADSWVLRRQAELLANAGVDAISTDNTNGTYTWKSSYTAIFKTWSKAQKDGVAAPKVTFMLPFAANSNTNKQLEMLYEDVYKSGKAGNLIYYLDGKPLIMAHPEGLDKNIAIQAEIADYFTFRKNYPGYINSSPSYGDWGWLSVYPQAVYYASEEDKNAGIAEQITVGVAQNHNYVTHELTAMNGQNVTDRTYTSKGYDTSEDAILRGANFAEQWEYALEIDPKTVYVTGWNEWIAGRYETWQGVQNAFPDEFNDLASRDIEPTKGVLRDNYYYQLVNYIRQYKGVRPIPEPSAAKMIDITAGTEQWADVLPYYAAYIGDTQNRNYTGYQNINYEDDSGRNDIIGAQIARDGEYIYILVECASDISPYTDPLWMNVLLDTDSANKGWEGYDYVINKTAPKDGSTAVLERFYGNGYESTAVADVQFSVSGRYLQIAVKKSDLGLDGNDFTINFSVTDNVHDVSGYEIINKKQVWTKFTGDILNFYTSGNVAPGGRFMYSYVSTTENSGEIPVRTRISDTSDADAAKKSGCSSACGAFAVAAAALAGAYKRKKEE